MKGLVSPTLYSQHGVYARDLLGPREPDEVAMCIAHSMLTRAQIRSLFAALGTVLSDEQFSATWDVAASMNRRGQVRPRAHVAQPMRWMLQ